LEKPVSLKNIFLDIDGTLITKKYTPFRDDVLAMGKAARKGHVFFLNTGRSFSNIPLPLLELPMIRGIAAGGGAHILINEGNGYRTIYRKRLPKEAVKKIFPVLKKRPRCSNFEGERNCYLLNPTPLPDTAKEPVFVHTISEFLKKSRMDIITKLTFLFHPSDEEKSILDAFIKINSFPAYTEGIIKGENKAKAMEIIMTSQNLRREDSIAIGDSENDLDMLRYAGLGIAMGNACEELKAAADAITGNCGSGGVAEALKKFVL